jgi:hypothetical protein
MALLFNADAERAKVFAGAFAHALPHLPFLTGTIPDTVRPHQAGLVPVGPVDCARGY